MKIIFETEDFSVKTLTGEGEDKPHVSREDGGHIIITPKVSVVDRTRLSPGVATHLMRLTMVAGEAMAEVMNERGVDIGRINYQDNGNWSVFHPNGPKMHIHLYGRAKSATTQIYGEALRFPKPETGFYKEANPFSDDDITALRTAITALLQEERYSNAQWNLL